MGSYVIPSVLLLDGLLIRNEYTQVVYNIAYLQQCLVFLTGGQEMLTGGDKGTFTVLSGCFNNIWVIIHVCLY